MPTYEYRCERCGQTLTLEMSVSAHDAFNSQLVEHQPPELKGETVACPECGGTELEQQFSAFYAKTSRKS